MANQNPLDKIFSAQDIANMKKQAATIPNASANPLDSIFTPDDIAQMQAQSNVPQHFWQRLSPEFLGHQAMLGIQDAANSPETNDVIAAGNAAHHQLKDWEQTIKEKMAPMSFQAAQASLKGKQAYKDEVAKLINQDKQQAQLEKAQYVNQPLYGEGPKNHPYASLIGSMIPYAVGGEVTGMGTIPELAEGGGAGARAAQIAKMIGKNAAFGTAAGGLANPQDPERGEVEGGVSQAIFGPILDAMGYGLSNKAKVLFRPKATPQEMQATAQSLEKDQPMLLGDVINSGPLRGVQNSLTKGWGTGMAKARGKVASALTNQGQRFLNWLKEDYKPEQLNQVIKNDLNESFKSVKGIKDQKYQDLDDYARPRGITVGNENEINALKNNINNIKNNIQTGTYNGKEWGGVVDNLQQRLDNLMNQNNKTSLLTMGPKSQRLSFKDASLKKANYNQASNDISGRLDEPDKKLKSSMYSGLAKAVDKDMEDAATNANDDKVKGLYDEANDYYKDHYSPYLDREIQNFLGDNSKKEAGQIVGTFIKGGPDDRQELESKLLDKLSPLGKQALAHQWLTRGAKVFENTGEGKSELNLEQVMKNYDKLGDNQKDVLFQKGTRARAQMDRLQNLYAKNKEHFKIKKGGLISADKGVLAAEALGLLPHFIDKFAHGGWAALASALGVALPYMGSRPFITKALESPTVRKMVIKSLENTNKPGIKSRLMSLAPAFGYTAN